MRIILTIDFSPWSAYSGGAQRSTHNLATSLAGRGHSVDVVYSKPLWENISVPADLRYELHWAILPSLRSRRKSQFRPLSTLSFNRVVDAILSKTEEQTIVHCNGEEGGLFNRLRKRSQCSIVSTPRHSTYPASLASLNSRSLAKKLQLIFWEGKYLMQRRAAINADLVVPASRHAALLVNEALDIDLAKMPIVFNGIEKVFFDRDPVRDPNGYLCFFGRFDKTKGVDTFIEAVANISDRIPNVLLIGRGQEESNIRQKIERLGLSTKIEVRGWMKETELAATLRMAQLAILPSRRESFGVAIANAMAIGLPVISSNVDAIPELIDHGKTGYLVPPGDSSALAEAILLLTVEKDYADELAKAGSAFVRGRYTWDIAAAEFEELYADLLNRT